MSEERRTAGPVAAAATPAGATMVVPARSGYHGKVLKVDLATGQWQRRGADIELVVVANARTPEVPLGGPTRLTGPGAG